MRNIKLTVLVVAGLLVFPSIASEKIKDLEENGKNTKQIEMKKMHENHSNCQCKEKMKNQSKDIEETSKSKDKKGVKDFWEEFYNDYID